MLQKFPFVTRLLVASVVSASASLVPFSTGGPIVTGQAQAATYQANDLHTISVSGSGELSLTPNIAYISLEIATQGKTAEEAQRLNAEAFAVLKKVLFEDEQLDRKDVRTTTFNVQPEYTYTDRERKMMGYQASQHIRVSYRTLDKVGVFLDKVVAAGVNRMNGIQFAIEKPQEYELQVIELAMKNAETKAKSIAQFAGKGIKTIVSVNASGVSGGPMPYERYAYAPVSGMGAADKASTSISPGDITLSTTVSVVYEME